MNNPVVVIGGNHHNALGVVRSLGMKGIKSYLILTEKQEERSYITYSKYIIKYWETRDSYDAFRLLLSHFVRFNDMVVVICCNDEIAWILDSHKTELPPNYYFQSTNRQEGLRYLMDKIVMAEMAEKVGLLIPKDYSESEQVIFPVIAKPRASIVGTKADIMILRDEKEYASYLSCHNRSQILIQQYIDRDFEYQLIGLSINGGEKIIIPGVSELQRRTRSSNTAFLKYTYLNSTCPIDKCKNFIKETGYSGLFSMEFIRDKRGADYFMEINYRNDGNAIAVTYAGVNLPYLWYQQAHGYFVPDASIITRPILFMPELHELGAVRAGESTLREWIKNMICADKYAEFAFWDQRPFWHLIINKIFKVRWI